ncbi:MDR family MFS transporter [Marinomonas ostreistagni]|uniref:MFS transporter n=1 Tax=Marinomonas ostreistagni TaxID=359209 RepID=A0ABS0ZG57_9GAMM|nr:MDR family MFS transporter [Marinomonas ostreistagni]MBJ7552665.1 MFS transporter [Marinomonas ostreistagni]
MKTTYLKASDKSPGVDQEKPSPKALRPILAGLMLAMSLGSLDQSIVNTALPAMASDLGGLSHLSWVVTAFMLSSTVATPIFGKLSDMYGRRGLLLSCIALFMMMSFLCGFAQSITQLIIFRLFQGIGAGGVMTLCQTSISDVVSPKERIRYQGLFTGTFAMSAVAGPILGGVLTTALSWRWIFYINIPIGLIAICILWKSLPTLKAHKKHIIDISGATTMVFAASSILLLFSLGGTLFPWQSSTTWILITIALTAIALFIHSEKNAAKPIMTLSLFRIRNFTIGSITTGCMGFAMMSAMVFLPLYFQLVLGLSAAQSGSMLLAQISAMLLTSIFGGQISSRLNRPKLFMIAGIALEALGLSIFAVLAYMQKDVYWFLIGLAILGLGMGIAMPHATVIVQNSAPKTSLGEATSTMSFIRSLGGALGVAVSGGVMTSTLHAGLNEIQSDIDVQQIINGGIAAVSVLPTAIRPSIELAFSHAITASFVIGGSVMLLAFFLSLSLENKQLRD